MLLISVLLPLLILVNTHTAFSKYPLVCEDISVGPSVLEILRKTLSTNVVDATLEALKLPPSTLDFHLPLLTWMSDIVYTIQFPSSVPSTYKEIYIVQENYANFNLFCHYFQSISWMNYFCTCSSDQKIQSKTWKDRIQLQQSSSFSDHGHYCVRKAYCYRSDPSSDSCSVSVDPFRKSCIFINSDKFNDGQIDDVITYKESYPRLSQILPSKQGGSPVTEEKDVIGDLLNFILNLVPYYPFLIVLGFVIIVNAEEIAETVICQKFFEGVLGITFALVLLYFAAQSVLGRILNRYNDSFLRFAQFPFVFSIISFVWYNPSSLAIIRDLLFQFWEKGAFGVPYLGKIYFISCVLISWSISTYFGWFSNESKLWPIILYGVRFVGLILLSQSASNRELSMIFVFVGCLIPYLLEWLYYLKYSFIIVESYRQRRKNVKKVTETELQRVTRIKTQNELAKLRNVLRNNPQLVQKTNDRFFEGNKNRQIELLNRFVSGSYTGKPGQYNQDEDDDIEEDLKERVGFVKYLFYVGLVLLIMVLVKFYKHYFQNFSASTI